MAANMSSCGAILAGHRPVADLFDSPLTLSCTPQDAQDPFGQLVDMTRLKDDHQRVPVELHARWVPLVSVWSDFPLPVPSIYPTTPMIGRAALGNPLESSSRAFVHPLEGS